MQALIIKEFRELARDRRTLAMLVVLPVILLIVFGYAANFSVDKVSVAVIGSEAQSAADKLDDYGAARDKLDITQVDHNRGVEDAEQLLRDRKADVVVVADRPGTSDKPISEQMRVYADGSNLFITQTAQGTFVQLSAEDAQNRIAAAKSAYRNAAEQTQREPAPVAAQDSAASPQPRSGSGAALPDFTNMESPTLNPDDLVTVLFNPELKTSWVMVPGLIGLILLFIGTLITSIGLVRERETGTLEQLAVMPLRPVSIIMGKIVPYFMLAIIDMAVITTLGVWLFGVPFNGSLWLFGLAAFVFLFVVLGIGVFISSISQNTGQAIQMAILFIVPQTLLSGLIFPLDSMPLGIRWISYALPLTWFREIAQGIMLRSATLEGIWFPLVILIAMAIVVFGAATARMRYTLTHGGARS